MKFTSFALAALAHHLACAAPTPVSDDKIAAAAHHHPFFPSGFPVASGGAVPTGFAFTGEKVAGAAFPSEHHHHPSGGFAKPSGFTHEPRAEHKGVAHASEHHHHHPTGSGAASPTGFLKSERDALEKGFAHHSDHHGGFPTGSGFPVPTGFKHEARAEHAGVAHASEHHHHHHHSSGVFPSGGALPTGFLKAEVEALNKFFPTGTGAGKPFPTGAFPTGGFKHHGEHKEEKRAEEHEEHHHHSSGVFPSGGALPTGFLKAEVEALNKFFPTGTGAGKPFPTGAFPTGGFKHHGEHKEEKRAEGVAHASEHHHHHHPHPTGSGSASATGGLLKSEKVALDKAYAFPSGALPSGGFPFPSGSGFPFPTGTGFPAFPTGTGFPFKA